MPALSMNRTITALSLAGILTLGAACAEPVDTDTSESATARPTTTTRPATTTTAPAYVPTPADFTVTPVVRTKQCFGSAGCNVTYSVDVTYIGLPWEDGTSYDVTFEVHGSDYGTAVDTITIESDGEFSVRERMTSTATEADELTATVTAVTES